MVGMDACCQICCTLSVKTEKRLWLPFLSVFFWLLVIVSCWYALMRSRVVGREVIARSSGKPKRKCPVEVRVVLCSVVRVCDLVPEVVLTFAWQLSGSLELQVAGGSDRPADWLSHPCDCSIANPLTDSSLRWRWRRVPRSWPRLPPTPRLVPSTWCAPSCWSRWGCIPCRRQALLWRIAWALWWSLWCCRQVIALAPLHILPLGAALALDVVWCCPPHAKALSLVGDGHPAPRCNLLCFLPAFAHR